MSELSGNHSKDSDEREGREEERKGRKRVCLTSLSRAPDERNSQGSNVCAMSFPSNFRRSFVSLLPLPILFSLHARALIALTSFALVGILLGLQRGNSRRSRQGVAF